MEAEEETVSESSLVSPNKKKIKEKRKLWVSPHGSYRLQKGEYYTTFNHLKHDEKQFFNSFRILRTRSFDELLMLVRAELQGTDTIMRRNIPPEEKLAVTLRWEH